jgi:hypothetical protein
MREVKDAEHVNEVLPVAVFYDQETAEGNAEGYNLEFNEREITGIRFYVAITAAYE